MTDEWNEEVDSKRTVINIPASMSRSEAERVLQVYASEQTDDSTDSDDLRERFDRGFCA